MGEVCPSFPSYMTGREISLPHTARARLRRLMSMKTATMIMARTSSPANMLPRTTPIDFALGVPGLEFCVEPETRTVPSTLKDGIRVIQLFISNSLPEKVNDEVEFSTFYSLQHD